MAQVQESVDVQVPVRTAYDQWTQFETFPRFMNGVESIRQIDATHTHWVTSVAGVHREFDAEITQQRPDEVVAWESTGGDTRHAGVVTFEPIDADTTRVTVSIDWEPSGVAEKVGAAVNIDDRQVRSDAKRFKEFIEQRG
ncbi:SRPBCC family protein [Spongisporangium articulatum]|uniref:SRPBCC family protein n=1 Tax=Spongisporangium articulatum TaxID=3362603 RepID=A0ABW8AGR1_9ACTN